MRVRQAPPAVRNVLREEERRKEPARGPTRNRGQPTRRTAPDKSASGTLPAATDRRRAQGLYINNVRQPAAQHLHEQRRAQLAERRRPSFLDDKGEVRLVENGFDLTPLPLLVDEAPPEEEAVVVEREAETTTQHDDEEETGTLWSSSYYSGVRERRGKCGEGRRAARRDSVD